MSRFELAGVERWKSSTLAKVLIRCFILGYWSKPVILSSVLLFLKNHSLVVDMEGAYRTKSKAL